MKKILLLLLFMLPLTVHASCSNSELSRYKTLASNLNSYYDYDENTNTFVATIENVHNDIYLYDVTNDKEYRNKNSGVGDINIYNLTPGKSVTLKVKAINSDCNKYNLYTLYLTIPHYNPYYSDKICNNSSSDLCSKWANTSALTYEQFVIMVKQSEKEVIKEEKEKEEEIKPHSFLDFLADYYIFILLAIIISGSFGIYVLDKKSKFDF